MRILVDGVICQLQARRPGGVSRYWRNLLLALQEQSQHEWVFLARAGHVPSGYTGKVRYGPAFSFDNPEVNASGFDVFISTYYTRGIGAPNVLIAHDLIPEAMGFEGPEWDMRRETTRQIQYAIAVSEATAKDLRHYYDIAEDHIRVVYEGVDPAFQGTHSQPDQALDYVLHVGSYVPYKFPAAYLDILPDILAEQRLGLAWPGHTHIASDAALRDLYRRATALIAPSSMEGFDLPVLEALACGCPVIASDIPVHREVAGEAALYVDPADPAAIERALSLARESRASLFVSGRVRASNFTWRRTADGIERALEAWFYA